MKVFMQVRTKLENQNLKYPKKEHLLLNSRKKKHHTESFPETLKYWVGVQRHQSYLMGKRCLFALIGHPSNDGVTMKMPYVVYQAASHPIFSHWVG